MEEVGKGLCQCGCGGKAPISPKTERARGYVAGEPRRFILGHRKRKKGFPDGLNVLLDEVDRDLEQSRWSLSNASTNTAGYLYRNPSVADKRTRRESLHRVVAERINGRPLRSDEIVDHINGNTLDNRRCNLRVGDGSLNCQNRITTSKSNTSGYVGVSWHSKEQIWKVSAKVNGVYYWIGQFKDIDDAGAESHEWRLKNMPGYNPAIYNSKT